MAEIWSELLEQGDIGPEDDFFELGGDSLLAVWLMEEIEERTGRNLPLSLLLEGATIRHLAKALDAQGAQPAPWRGINAHGGRCPLFWIHGWAELLSMRNHLDADQPVFQLGPACASVAGQTPLELSARRYVEKLRRIQREGPYQLIGYSFGGVIAYEMARQLVASGERVNFLGLLDTPAPGYVFPLSARVRMHTATTTQFRRMLAELRTRSWLGRGTYLRHTVPAITRHRWFRWLLKTLPDDWRVPTPPGSIVRIHYHPESYPGHIVLFRATGGRAQLNRTPDLGWAPLADGGISVRAVPGNHRTMAYGPNGRMLARHVTECLTQAPH